MNHGFVVWMLNLMITCTSVDRTNLNQARPLTFVGTFLTAMTVAAMSWAAEPSKLSVSFATGDQGRQVFDLRGIDANEIAALVQTPKKRFAIYAVFTTELADPPPLAGQYQAVPDALRFTPRFPLQPGMKYRAVYQKTGDSKPYTLATFSVPARSPKTAARVAAISPSAEALPQNQLKFYLYFTAPMSRGGAYERLRLLDATGAELDLPFLELAEELWNPAGDRLTLLLDPARVKQGLKAREEAGPVLMTGERYTLVVNRRFCDAAGQPLAAEFRKTFCVAEADETRPDPKHWRLAVPKAGTKTPLTVDFGEPLDRALLQRMLWVVNDQGERTAGEAKIGRNETSWRFRPRKPWLPGRYRLVADTELEDLAGNNLTRKFELDGRRAAEPADEEATATVPFHIEE
jgi:hypothetical protein